MTKITIALLVFLTTNVFAATTTVNPFTLEFYTPESKHNIEVSLTQSCRYEKIVWGDSAEYYTQYKDVPLKVKNTNLGNGLIKHQYKLTKKQVMKITGMFKPTKECKTELEVKILDSQYSIGWANQYSKPISFLFYDFQSYRPGDSTFNISGIADRVEDKVFSFDYRAVGSQVNTTLLADGVKVSNLMIVSVALNKKTQMPFRLR
mgnify:CR=1 FL=1